MKKQNGDPEWRPGNGDPGISANDFVSPVIPAPKKGRQRQQEDEDDIIFVDNDIPFRYLQVKIVSKIFNSVNLHHLLQTSLR